MKTFRALSLVALSALITSACLSPTQTQTLLDRFDRAVKQYLDKQVTPADPDATPEVIPDNAPTPDAPAANSQDEINLAAVTWLGPDIRSWPITSDLPGVSISGGKVRFKHSKAGKWPAKKVGDGMLEGNPWVVAQVSGKWYGASFEWLRPNQTEKPTYTVAGDHCKQSPLSGSWAPKSGDTLYIGVSALARGKERSVSERTRFVKVVWP